VTPTSFQQYGSSPSAILSDGVTTVPLWAVTAMSLTESYQLPPIGSSTARAVVANHDDSVSLSGVLVGPERGLWKAALETLAEVSKRGGAIARLTGGRVQGLVLVTSLTIRTDMQVQSVTFNVAAVRRDVIDVSLQLAHMPLPSSGFGALLDVALLQVAGLADWGTA
jgi:hypothetical protein